MPLLRTGVPSSLVRRPFRTRRKQRRTSNQQRRLLFFSLFFIDKERVARRASRLGQCTWRRAHLLLLKTKHSGGVVTRITSRRSVFARACFGLCENSRLLLLAQKARLPSHRAAGPVPTYLPTPSRIITLFDFLPAPRPQCCMHSRLKVLEECVGGCPLDDEEAAGAAHGTLPSLAALLSTRRQTNRRRLRPRNAFFVSVTTTATETE